MKKMPAVFVRHGSPMIALDHNELTDTYNRLGKRILEKFGQPKAILMISAHWYTHGTLVQSAAKPRQVYDMYGFPPELYALKYEPTGCADLTRDVTDLLGADVEIDDSWGIDHGAWSILVHIFPKAALGAEGIGKDVTMIVGNGYTKNHAQITLDVLRENPKLRKLFDEKYC